MTQTRSTSSPDRWGSVSSSPTRAVLAGTSRWLLRIALAIAGVAMGRVVDHITHGASVHGIAAANATAPYGLIVAVFALRRRPVRAGIDAAVFFAAFVIGYYLTLAREHGLAAINHHYAAVWLLLAVTACPALVALVAWARARPGVLRAAVFAVPAGAACTEALSGRTWGMADTIDPIVVVLDAALVLVYLVLLPRGVLTKAAAFVWTAPVVAALLAVTASLAADGAYDRWMY